MTVRTENDRRESVLRSIDEFSNREDIRKYLLYLYAEEDCKTKLRYYVENLEDGNRVYLERPTFLNKGCDFQIYVENLITYNNGNDKCPSHGDVFADLEKKKAALKPQQYQKLISAIEDIFNIVPYKKIVPIIEQLPQPVGWPYDTLLKLVRWLFIEQDITYWAQTGREMLMAGIRNV